MSYIELHTKHWGGKIIYMWEIVGIENIDCISGFMK